MSDLNIIAISGNLTRDPELSQTASGKSVCNMRIGWNVLDFDGLASAFIDITAWGKQAESCAEHLRKKSPIIVEGRLKMNEWEKDGRRCSNHSITANKVHFISGGGERG